MPGAHCGMMTAIKPDFRGVGPMGTGILTSTHYQKTHLHAWWTDKPMTTTLASHALDSCYDRQIIQGAKIGKREFLYLTGEQNRHIDLIYDHAYAFELVGRIIFGEDYFLTFLMSGYGPNYDVDPTDWSGPVDVYTRHSTYPQDHWHHYKLSNNAENRVRGSQTITINTWHAAAPEDWVYQGYCQHGISDKYSGWHLPLTPMVPFLWPLAFPSAPMLVDQAMQEAPMLDVQPILEDTPMQIEMGGAVATMASDENEESRRCGCFPMVSFGGSSATSSREPLLSAAPP